MFFPCHHVICTHKKCCQALFFPLRTAREEMAHAKKLATQAAARSHLGLPVPATQITSTEMSGQADVDQSASDGESFSPKRDATPMTSPQGPVNLPGSSSDLQRTPSQGTPIGAPHSVSDSSQSFPPRQAWDYIEELFQILKTGFPLLLLSMETIVDQIFQRFKGSHEEETYRLVCMLMQEGISVSVSQHNILAVFIQDAPELYPANACHGGRWTTPTGHYREYGTHGC
jgi:transformation/transcription domain-associated protein